MVLLSFLWLLVRFNCACNSFEHWQPSMGLTWIPRAFEPYHESCMRCGCIILLTVVLDFYQTWLFLPCFLVAGLIIRSPCGTTAGQLHPFRRLNQQYFQVNFVEVIWWTNMQSQAQSQAQTQGQLAALREQNSILNQQLASQAQSHIQHLQQLLPFHQPTSTPHPPQSTPSAPEPPTPVAPQSTPPGSSVSFNPEEMMQQMKDTVESSMQAFVDKNQERNKSHPPLPAQPPIPISPPIPSHPPPPDEFPPPQQRSHRRSRSHRHRSGPRIPDKRPISVPRSPRRQRSSRRIHRSSRPRSSPRRRRSTSRNVSRRPSRAASITLRSASPCRREVPHWGDDDHSLHEPSHRPASLHPATWEHHPQPSSHTEHPQSNYHHYDHHSTNKWKSWGQWKDYPKSSYTSSPSGWICMCETSEQM